MNVAILLAIGLVVCLALFGCATPVTHSMSSHENTTSIGKVDHARVPGSGIGISGGPETGPADHS